jgi:uncharacterized protein (DUF1697 family)
MNVVVSLLRGVNLGGHNQVKMSELCALYGTLGHCDARSHINSGNIVFRTKQKNLAAVATKIEDAIEKKYGFRVDVVVRTPDELRAVIRRNPFAKRKDIHPSKFLVTFFAREPAPEICAQIRSIKPDPELMHLDGRELYIYFPNGVGQSKLFRALSAKPLKKQGTARNWNTVSKLLEIAETLEAL